ncbi:hypothetical protein UP09_26635 [Bradyrhizobium sp. LTSP885]|uniref:hypothetical protein n=1 Tax=Bradyrhizobium sp. LTSP885 TaxID=1619232 RepID=UPI0005C9A610|nr:hypothetical protein [Bradyrhizobium sp. LTSP885]KJC38034.1 hypothetical protein UP09_26635 [Bradyrhizobium sp. LTSP885]
MSSPSGGGRPFVRNRHKSRILALAAALAFWLPAPGFSGAAPAKGEVCASCIRIRVGVPTIVRGPAADIADNKFSEIALPNGRFRGFDAHAETRAIDGIRPSDMGGPARVVLRPGPPGSVDSCGQWLNHAERTGATVLGFIHDETACNYPAGQTHKSMSLATSSDDGLTWHDLGQIITGTDRPTPGKNTGEGDCTAVDGRDSFYYLYCFRPRDGALIAARAPLADPGPGQWKKYFDGKWDEPGLGGQATRLMNGSGSSVARWTASGELALTGWVPGGLGLFLTRDHVTLKAVPEPLLVLDPGVWQRPAPSELVTYPVLLDAATGGNQLSNSWLLVYAYWPPGGGHADKYLVVRPVDVSRSDTQATPQVGVQLARWYNSALHDRWSTTGPVPGNGTSYRFEAQSGYLMTAAAAGAPMVELEDCVSLRPGHPDHLLAEKGFCEAHAYQRLRTAGWVSAQAQPGTIPLYRCYNAREQSHFASNAADCEKLGANERLLGYALKP